MDRPDNGQDEGREYLAGLRAHSTNPTLLRAVAEVEAELDTPTSARAGAGEQQREHEVIASWLAAKYTQLAVPEQDADADADELLALLAHTDEETR